ncbi:phosphatase inhibitor-domain-containing protein [Fimicolochytrium jonesii]|uniref:phosphatase inhibitor-domain-containing protein n=1 Tax=Fimicolochytrium jonesii TaxID=1396493 RepID=UPI0022FE2172|nr:phosphatase inhibitor-domain-containing protein [Fimicolochytrium jonesii]KAI8824130.1 phosphatase inhibitor-domain-containing protein [Fimicolochytrium jonesii]
MDALAPSSNTPVDPVARPGSATRSQTQQVSQQQRQPLSGSQTQTVEHTELAPPPVITAGTLHLRGGNLTDRKVQWDDDVVDNEGLGKKSSKVCCIFRKPHNPDDTSSDSESSSGSEADDPNEPNAYEREPKSVRKHPKRKGKANSYHHHEHAEECSHNNGPSGSGSMPV